MTYEFKPAAVFYFDYLLTFSDEVKLLWGRRFSIVKVLFILSRYTVCFAGLIRFLDYAYSWGDSQIDVVRDLGLHLDDFFHVTCVFRRCMYVPRIRGAVS